MISSIFYPPKASNQNKSQQQTQVDNFRLFQIIAFKIIVILISIFFPLLLKGDNACFVLTLAIAFQFWINKNLARTFVKAYWYIDTSTEKDRWVYEAQVTPTTAFQGLFWYSSIIYFILLCICFIYYISRSQVSLSCSLLIGLICAYLNFFAYSKIIKARNSGKLHNQADENKSRTSFRKTTIQLPLIAVPSHLKQIKEEQQNVQYA